MKTLQDSISCIAVALLFWLTLAFFGIFLCGCFSLIEISTVATATTGLQVFALLFIGGLFTLIGSMGIGKIVNELLKA
ncbi:uncharacterized protein METZ01_LOCUS168918 [marine metagenome]|uniref:Uncharacterized protein n=1 Tax=marine metagenome TaxID=408172 RepID=A0A382BQX3_9ZZZZ